MWGPGKIWSGPPVYILYVALLYDCVCSTLYTLTYDGELHLETYPCTVIKISIPETTGLLTPLSIWFKYNSYNFIFYPYIAHEGTAKNLDVVRSLVALRSYSY